MRYSIAGREPGAGAVTTGADGTAAITWTGAKAGTDTLTAFVDRDGNGVRDVNTEPQQTATVTWTPAPPPAPPVPGKSVVVKVVSGQVLIKLPAAGARGRRARRRASCRSPGAANIPVGSQLDTSKGRVALTSAADTGGKKTQTSDFYEGIFQVKQAVPKKKPKKADGADHRPGDEGSDRALAVRAAEGRARRRPTKKKKGPKAVLGKLWGNGKGKFRTNGKYSAATVRGTIWLVAGSLRGHADEGVARDGPGARLQAQEDRDGQGGPQLPRARPAGGKQGQAAIDRATNGVRPAPLRLEPDRAVRTQAAPVDHRCSRRGPVSALEGFGMRGKCSSMMLAVLVAIGLLATAASAGATVTATTDATALAACDGQRRRVRWVAASFQERHPGREQSRRRGGHAARALPGRRSDLRRALDG